MIDQWRAMSPEDREVMVDSSEAVAKDYVVNLEAARRGIDPANNGRVHLCDVLCMAAALVLAREEVKELRAAVAVSKGSGGGDDTDYSIDLPDSLAEALSVSGADADAIASVTMAARHHLDRAFLDGYSTRYIADRPGFVSIKEAETAGRIALSQWHAACQGDPVDDCDGAWSCESCGVEVDEGKTHCGSLECGGGRLPEVP